MCNMSCDSGSVLSEVVLVMEKTLDCVMADELPLGFMLGWCFVKDIAMATIFDPRYNITWAIPKEYQLSHDFNPAVVDMCHALITHFAEIGVEAVRSLACVAQQHTHKLMM